MDLSPLTKSSVMNRFVSAPASLKTDNIRSVLPPNMKLSSIESSTESMYALPVNGEHAKNQHNN